MIIELPAKPPFSLDSVVQSHGWARLAPFQTYDGRSDLTYIFQLRDHQVVELNISENPDGISVSVEKRVQSRAKKEIESAVTWMLGLNDDFEEFYKISRIEPKLSDAQAKAQGRLLRSPTMFEDTIKTILTTNTSWSGTIRMTESLVSQFGALLPGSDGVFSFPDPGTIARSNEKFLREKTRLGYRAPYILDLARRVDSGSLNLESLKSCDLSGVQLHKELTSIKGVGNYAAANLMMLLGNFEYLTIDSWALKMVSNEFFEGEPITPAEVEQIFEPWGEWKGLAYWLWNWSEHGVS